jgi:hypothetical protein
MKETGGDLALMEGMKNFYITLAGKAEQKTPFCRTMHGSWNIIKWILN